MNACSITFLCLCFSALHYVSYTTHTITNCTKQPTHASKATTKALKTTMDSNVVSPTMGSRKTAMKTPLIYSERRLRRRRWPPPSPPLPWRPPPTQATSTLANHATAASFVSIACAFQILDGFLVSGGATHTPCGCACTLYSPNYENTPGFRLSCS